MIMNCAAVIRKYGELDYAMANNLDSFRLFSSINQVIYQGILYNFQTTKIKIYNMFSINSKYSNWFISKDKHSL